VSIRAGVREDALAAALVSTLKDDVRCTSAVCVFLFDDFAGEREASGAKTGWRKNASDFDSHGKVITRKFQRRALSPKTETKLCRTIRQKEAEAQRKASYLAIHTEQNN